MIFRKFSKRLPWLVALVLLAWALLEYLNKTGDKVVTTFIFLALLVNIASAAIAWEYHQFLEERKGKIFEKGDDDFRA